MSGPVIVAGVRPERPIERQLLAELKAAHRLLSVALGCMTPAGKAKFARQSEVMGFGEDGATRHHERAAVIEQAEQRFGAVAEPRRGANWPLPSSDPAVRDAMAREHRAQQRAAIVGGEESPL